MNNKLLLVNEKTNFLFEKQYPKKLSPIKAIFNIVIFKDPILKNYKLSKSDGRIYDLNNYDYEEHYLIRSPIYNNRYYLLEEFEDMFRNDFNNVLTDIAFNIGCIELKCNYKKVYKVDKKREIDFKGKISSQKNYNIDASAMLKKDIGSIEKNKYDIYFKNENKTIINTTKFKEWINKEDINLEFFYNTPLCIPIKKFLSSDSTYIGTIATKEKEIKIFEEINETIAKIGIKIDVIKNLINPKLDLTNMIQKTKNYKYIKSFEMSLKF